MSRSAQISSAVAPSFPRRWISARVTVRSRSLLPERCASRLSGLTGRLTKPLPRSNVDCVQTLATGANELSCAFPPSLTPRTQTFVLNPEDLRKRNQPTPRQVDRFKVFGL